MKYLLFPIFLLLISCGGEGVPSDNPPNIAGTYDLTNATPIRCPLFFDSPVIVVQDGSNIIIQATHIWIPDREGTINNNGEFTVISTEGSICDGQFKSGVVIEDCVIDGMTCTVTYTRQ